MAIYITSDLKNRRIKRWIGAALLLMVPLVAMQFTEEVQWSPSDFLFAGILLFGSLAAFEAVARSSTSSLYRTGAGLAVFGAFLLTWANAAVGLTDSDADGLYLAVVALGVIGAFVAQFRPMGMAYTMITMAVALAAVGLIALLTGIVPEHNSAVQILAITCFFAAFFVGSALLFRKAARKETSGSST
jgi:hypothetical protein